MTTAVAFLSGTNQNPLPGLRNEDLCDGNFLLFPYFLLLTRPALKIVLFFPPPICYLGLGPVLNTSLPTHVNMSE